ncbi:hypothetical protein Bbelb_084430 [Branchiostoma belcheri]|nr:hypothetical protein Bbelb_084430 [Branchiostoma belcheri]
MATPSEASVPGDNNATTYLPTHHHKEMEVTEENQSQKKESEHVDRQYKDLGAEHGRVNVMLGRGAKFQREAPRKTLSRHLDMGDHVVEYPEYHEDLSRVCSDDKAYTQEDTNADEEAGADRVYKAGDPPVVSDTQPPECGEELVFPSCPRAAPWTSPGDTPMKQPQTDWRSRADAAANINNPMYNTRKGARHGQQHQTDITSSADATANVANPIITTATDRAILMWGMVTSSKICRGVLVCGLLVIVVIAASLAPILAKGKVPHDAGKPDIDDIVNVSASPSTFDKDNSSAFPSFSSTPFKADLNQCTNNSCHPGTCEVGDGGYKCICKIGWTGKNCQNDVNECVARPCGHGHCGNYPGGYRCTCLPGWTGQNCRQDMNECTENPCQHGSCVDRDGGYYCNCLPGWIGIHCQQAQPCQSGWSEYNNHCYKLIKDKVCWSTANKRCQHLGANLASVGSAGENNFIAHLITDAPGGQQRHLVWFGLTLGVDGQWKWTDGSRFSYTNWAKNEPGRNLFGRKVNCANLYSKDGGNWFIRAKGKKGEWNDDMCSTHFPYICETPK